MRLVLLGPPGSGKGTQGGRLARDFGIPHVATGDLIRDHVARGTPFGRTVEDAIARGNFAPDSDILYWVRERLGHADARPGYVLDGFPRDLAQASLFDAALRDQGERLDAVIALTIGVADLVQRLEGRLVCPTDGTVYHVVNRPPRRPGLCDLDGTPLVRRPDDEPDAVLHRLDVYEAVTLPLRAYYERQGLLRPVDAQGTADEVHRRILSVLEARKNEAFRV